MIYDLKGQLSLKVCFLRLKCMNFAQNGLLFSYCVLFSRILPLWIIFSIGALLLLLFCSPNGGFEVMVFTFVWVIMLFIGIFFCIIIRKYVRFLHAACAFRLPCATEHLKTIILAGDCSKTLRKRCE